MKLTIVSLFTVTVVIAFTFYPGKAEESQEHSPKEFSMVRLQNILNSPSLNYWKEIKKHVTKPCMKYFAEWKVKHSKTSPFHKILKQQEVDELIDSRACSH